MDGIAVMPILLAVMAVLALFMVAGFFMTFMFVGRKGILGKWGRTTTHEFSGKVVNDYEKEEIKKAA